MHAQGTGPGRSSKQRSLDQTEADGADYRRILANVLAKITYAGVGIDHRPSFRLDADPGGRRIYLTRPGVRRIVGPDVPDLVVGRLVTDLTALADDLEHEVSALIIARTVDRSCALTDQAAGRVS